MRINGKKITVIASDFDGTVIRHGMSAPTEQFYELINTCLDQNIFFVAASGRQYSNLYRLLHNLKREIAYISENGSLVTYQGQVIYKAIIDEVLAWQLLQDMLADMNEGYDFDIMVSGEDTSYFLDRNPEFEKLVEKNLGNRGRSLADFHEMNEPMIKISMYFPGGIPRELAERYHAKYDNRLQVVDAGNDWFDFNPAGSSKGTALQVLAGKLGLCLEETIAFGDGENDIPMLEACGIAFSMSTAKLNVQAAADYICDSVEDVICYGLEQETELEQYAKKLALAAEETQDGAERFWNALTRDEEILEEFAYFYSKRDFLCKYKVAGYSVVDILVWQVDHFKAYLDRHSEVNRYDRDKLVFKAFGVLLKMRTDPKFYTDKLEGETGTDYEGKY